MGTLNTIAGRYFAGPARELKSRREVERVWARYVEPALGRRRVAALQYEDFDRLKRRMRATPVQANRVLALCSTLMVWAIRWQYRPDNPVAHVKRYRENERAPELSADELTRLRSALESERRDPESAVFLELLLLTGARVSELARAGWSGLDRERRVLGTGEGKNGDVRRLYLSEAAMRVIVERLEPKDTGAMFNRDIATRSERVWRRIRRDAGLPWLHRHDLRHVYASQGLSAGANLAEIGALLGHRSTQSTRRYTHLLDDHGTALADKIGRRLAS